MNKILPILLILSFIPILLIGQNAKWNYQPKKISQSIKKTVKQIKRHGEIHTKAIGYSGKRTTQYNRFEKLVKKATINELVELTEHPKPVVRGYAFWALAKRGYKDLEEVFVQHANDQEWVYNIQACMGGELPLIEFMRWVVSPNMLDLDCKKLDKAAIKRMYEQQKTIKESKSL